jgi:hypothetical protein
MKSDYEIWTMDPIQRQLWRSPVTTILAFGLGIGILGALIYTFVFSDTWRERLEHAAISLTLLVWMALLLAFVKKKEDKRLFPAWLRRSVWLSIVLVYVGGFVLAIWPMGRSSGDPFQRLQFSLRLGFAAPIPFLAWRLLRDKKPNHPRQCNANSSPSSDVSSASKTPSSLGPRG